MNAREENAYTLAVQAGLWRYPLAHRAEAFPPTLTVQGIGPNSFQKFDRLRTAADRFVVTPNNLTIDAYAILDVSDGPVVLYVPAFSAPRYFIVQIGDVFDDVIHKVAGARPAVPGAYIITGPRAPGPRAGRYDAGQPAHEAGLRRRAGSGSPARSTCPTPSASNAGSR